jgi:alkanesulfonate monooxygenase SsuD/methylene tetrahydromethanopterin reductase-like flavin-dependent oxidoreductase (luciferase family)
VQEVQPQIRFAKPRHPVVRLTTQEVAAAFEPLSQQFPPVLSLTQAAALAGLKAGTLKRKVSEGCYAGCVRLGKPLLFWRDRFIKQIFEAA